MVKVFVGPISSRNAIPTIWAMTPTLVTIRNRTLTAYIIRYTSSCTLDLEVVKIVIILNIVRNRRRHTRRRFFADGSIILPVNYYNLPAHRTPRFTAATIFIG